MVWTDTQKAAIKSVLREAIELADFKTMLLRRIDFLERTVDLLYERIMNDKAQPQS